MPSFSQRYGYKPTQASFQRESLDETTRTKLWNILKLAIWDDYQAEYLSQKNNDIDNLCRRIWHNLFDSDLDGLPAFRPKYATGRQTGYDIIKHFFFSCDWHEAFDLLEFIAQDVTELLTEDAREALNMVLEHHNSAYRFVGQEISEITDTNEIGAIEEGLTHPETPVRAHLEAALHMLSNRDSPDYRNSVKESISAVEAACRLATGDASATLGDALKRIPNTHSAFTAAMSKLYGYTSDADGVRHSLMSESTITYADAKYMLVACAAFVSYLKTAAA